MGTASSLIVPHETNFTYLQQALAVDERRTFSISSSESRGDIGILSSIQTHESNERSSMNEASSQSPTKQVSQTLQKIQKSLIDSMKAFLDVSLARN